MKSLFLFGRFDENEYETMKLHTVLGARLFSDRKSDFDEAAIQVALNHHEHWDGNGYPGYVDIATGKPLKGYTQSDGSAVSKRGEEIPLYGRIVAIADVYDALSSERVYKDAWDESDVHAKIKAEAGHQFDPELVDVFFSRLKIIHSIKKRYQDDSTNI